MTVNNKKIILLAVGVFLTIAALVAAIFYFKIFWPVGQETNRQQAENKNMAKQNENLKIRKPAVAGSFYPGEKDVLEKMVENFLEQAPAGSEKNLRAIIVPHAGYEYSGQVAAYSFKQIDPADFDKVIILAPSHNFPVAGIFGSGADVWETPLGQVKILEDAAVPVNDEVHEPEHAIEVEAPFLQVVFGSVGEAGYTSGSDTNRQHKMEILPIIVGALNKKQIDELAEWLKIKLADERTLIIVSVDLSHYHDYETAKKLDEKSINTILALDRDGVDGLEIDAPYAIKALIKLAKDLGWEPELLQYANSGDVTGDKSRVVGYGAMGFYKNQKSNIKNQKLNDEYSEEEKSELLKIARTTLEEYYKDGKIYKPETENKKFLEKRGVFVTLNKAGQLRGCIGYIEPIKSLIEAVQDNVLAAALEDSRFSPVTADELAEIEIEISVLTVPEATSLAEIQKGDGVILQLAGRGATYLPQVWEDISDRETFFSSLCQKAGLAGDCWQDKETEFYKYQAVVFHE